MYCPKCGYGRMPEGTRYCPKCGAPVEIAARVDIRQDVEHNLGRVIGIQTDAIYGDVYGGDIHYHQPQVYVLTRAGRAANWRLLLEENTPPYKGMSPYTARDRALFKGRDTKIRQVVRRIGEQRLLVIYGQAGVGKTSLLAAGVIPNLTEYGALVVYIPEYTQPVEKTFRNALADCGDQIPIALPDEALPALVRTVFEATQGTLVLVLDQFERAFEPSISDEQRTALIEGLAQALRAVGPEFLRLVVVVRGDTLKRLGELQDRLPNLLRSPIELPPLDRQQAQTAIEQPLCERDYPISYVRGLVAEQIVPDLDELTPTREMSGLIHPLQLQIVCNWLYDAARERHPPLIDAELYINEAEGADGIMACHLKKTLGQLGDKQALAERVLANMVSPGVERWVLPEQLPLNGASSEQVLDVLESLRKAGLLVQHAANGQDKYAFASDCVAEEVLRGTGPEVKRRYQAGDEMGRIRSTWYARKALATRGQLRYLTEAGAHLTPRVVEALLLLRSAVARDEPAGPWLKWLRTDEGRALIQQLEEPTTSKQAWHSSRSTMHTAKLLLGMRDDDQPGPPGNEGEGFGPVAWSAVGHPEPAIRQTAALALTVPDRRTALNRLDEALQAGVQGWRRRWRRAELRGALANADPEIERQNASLPPLDRAGVWLWRVWRWWLSDRHRFFGLTLGGAVGAGLGLGLLRAIIAIPTTRRTGAMFGIFFFYAAILGAALSSGMALAGPLLLRPPREMGETPHTRQASWPPDRLMAALAAVLGTLFFGFGHILVAGLHGIHPSKVPLIGLMGLVAGLGLSLALYAQPWAGRRPSIGHWLLRLGAAALAFGVTQWIFIRAGNKWSNTLAIGWSGSFYSDEFSRYTMERWQQLMERHSQWFDYLAIFDAILEGIVLTIGITAGLLLAARLLDRWHTLVNRVGD